MGFDTEKTPEGTQTLVSGVKPLSERERLEWRARQPMGPKKPQKPLNVGLFDEDARKQTDLIDLLRETRS